jgi:hypothetical protein
MLARRRMGIRPVEERAHAKGENGSVGGSEARPLNPSLRNKDLMAEGEDFGVFAIATHQKQPDTGNQKPEEVRKYR